MGWLVLYIFVISKGDSGPQVNEISDMTEAIYEQKIYLH